jgi:DNA-binding GntR family transcriptional regulator
MSATESTEEWSLLNESFHEHFVISQANTRLFAMAEALSRAARPYVNLSMHVDRDLMKSNNREHAGLLAAYESLDADAVYEQTRKHLENTKAAVVKYVDHWLTSTETVE